MFSFCDCILNIFCLFILFLFGMFLYKIFVLVCLYVDLYVVMICIVGVSRVQITEKILISANVSLILCYVYYL